MRAQAADLRERIGVDWSQRSTKVGAVTTAVSSTVLVYRIVDAGIDRIPDGWMFNAFIFLALGTALALGLKGFLVKDKVEEREEYDHRGTAEELPEDLQDLIDEGRE